MMEHLQYILRRNIVARCQHDVVQKYLYTTTARTPVEYVASM